MERLEILFSVCLLAVALAACNGGAGVETMSPNVTKDTLPEVSRPPTSDSVSTPDEDLRTRTEDLGEGDIFDIKEQAVPIGEPCGDSGDCNGGYCVEGPDGSVCTHSCVEECPEGYSCKGVDLFGGDLVWLCMPDWWDLCESCEHSEDCGGDLDECVKVPGEGSFCGLGCGLNGECPAGYLCLEAELAGGEGASMQCLPEGGTCLCLGKNAGEIRACQITNAYGSCLGEQVCLGGEGWSDCDADQPAPETCNGDDEDCDGVADEGFPDTDSDGEANCVDKDDDGDGVPDELDNCPLVGNSGQSDVDNDMMGDACDDDDDNDGWPDEADCAPFNAAAHPKAEETCDGKDNNCNGQVDEGYADTDLDGMANCVDPDDDNDGVLDPDDCDPLNGNVYPEAPEACDGQDNDCDGKVDEGFADLDGDGIADCTDIDTDGDGDPDLSDCAPMNSAIFNGADELCDGLDNNCNGQVDEGYADIDQDGMANCVDPDDDNDGDLDDDDCNPLDPNISSNGQETCDGLDNNCNGKVDEGYGDTDGDGEADCTDLDDDGDGDPDVADCNPLDAEAYHGATEVCDGKDNDCDGNSDEAGSENCLVFFKDKDDDGFGMDNVTLCLCQPTGSYTASQGGDCDDSALAVHPGQTEVCNNQDDDCDGQVDNPGSLGCDLLYEDLDNDGYGHGEGLCLCWEEGLYTTDKGGDCDEENPFLNPGIPEVCDGIDNNCDGVVDEGVGSSCGNCDPSCNQINIGPGGDENFVLEDENASGLSQDPDGNLILDSEQVSLAFIWIANSGESTVSKLDTTNGKETSRFRVCSDPSRTAVDLYGDVWVACRGDGGVAKIIVYEKNCPDVNGNGTIETSRDLNNDGHISGGELLPKGQDECVKFIAYPGGTVQRSAGVDSENYGWVGEYNSKTLRRLHPDTGAVVQTIGLPANPYGLVIDGNGIIWISGRGGNKLVRVDPATNQVNSYASNIGCFEPYGINLDNKGRVWIGNCCCWHVAYRFDPATNQWAAAGTHARPRGIAGSADGFVYVANDQSHQVAVVNADSMQTVGYINLGSNRFPVGMAVDFDGYVWAVNQSGNSATKINPDNLSIIGEYSVGSAPYTYSDMTGYALHNYTQPQGYYQHVIPGGPAGQTQWTVLDVDVTFQGESTAKVRLRSANTVAGLNDKNWEGPFGPFPPNVFPMDLEAVPEMNGKYLQVEIVLTPDENGSSPLLKGFSVQYQAEEGP